MILDFKWKHVQCDVLEVHELCGERGMYRTLGTVPVEMLSKFLAEWQFSVSGLRVNFSETPCPSNNLTEINTRV
jgi:hypothetical protein